ncbi:MAG: TrmH family RNA methyltransferase [Acidobacteriaceae bacterium]|nr:TrmH family RNA methyltransferase [Acidobacteriaceae bacterium]MBV9778437.1 TrmH family RNA methyltransferase [Acidobacteriaceae bacterium]
MERIPYIATSASERYSGLQLPVGILLDNVRSMYNVGAFFRTADGAGVERILLSGITARPPKTAISKTALGADAVVQWEGVDDPITAVHELRTRGYEIAAIETSMCAVDIFEWQPQFPVFVLFGHEVDGLTPALLNYCDTRVRIPMLGSKHSLNVASAGAIVMYELLRKYRALREPRNLSLNLEQSHAIPPNAPNAHRSRLHSSL